MSFIKDLFQDQALVDTRTPTYTFEIPGVEGTWGLFSPTLAPWLVFVYLVLIQTVIQCIFAVFTYNFVVKRRGTVESYLIGWGFVIPIGIYIPFAMLDYLELQNRMTDLSASCVMTVLCFRCLEAMYDTSPPFVEDNVANYIQYYTTVIPFVWDPKTRTTKKISGSNLAKKFLNLMSPFFGLMIMLSILRHYDYEVLPTSVALEKLEFNWEVFSVNHLVNAYLHALLIYNTLNFSFELSAFSENMKGIDTPKLFDQPLLKSRSPTEFWTKRWNMFVHPQLKNAIFRPTKKFFGTKVAVFFTFFVSGLYHDYVWLVVFHDVKDEDGNCISEICYNHAFGRVTIFFAYVGFIMLLERPAAKLPIVQWLSTHLPSPVIAHLLLLLHLPISYFYYGDWMRGGFFDHYAIAIWQVKKIA